MQSWFVIFVYVNFLAIYESLLGFIPTFLMQKCIKEHKPGIKNDDKKPGLNDVHSGSVVGKVDTQQGFANERDEAGQTQQPTDDETTQAAIIRLLSVSDDTKESQFAMPDSLGSTPSIANEFEDENKGGEGNETETKTNGIGEHDHDDGSSPIDNISTERLFELLQLDLDNGEIKADFGACSGGQLSDTTAVKTTIMEQIRKRLLEETFKLPHWIKYISIGCIIAWSLMCAIITSIWCLWFEMKLTLENEYQQDIDEIVDSCNDDGITFVNIPLKTMINYNTTQSDMDTFYQWFEENGNSLYTPPSSSDSFSGNDAMKVSSRFLLCVLYAYLLSVFLWQPIAIAIKSMLRLRSLSKNPDQVSEALLFYQDQKSKWNVKNHEQNGEAEEQPKENEMEMMVIQELASESNKNDQNGSTLPNDQPDILDEFQHSIEVTNLNDAFK